MHQTITTDKSILYSMRAHNDAVDDCTVVALIGGQDGKTTQKGRRDKMQALESVMQVSTQKEKASNNHH